MLRTDEGPECSNTWGPANSCESVLRVGLSMRACPVCMHACFWEQVMQAQVYKYAHRRAAAALMKQQSGIYHFEIT